MATIRDEPIETLEETRSAWNRIAAGYDEFVTPTHMWLASEGLRRAGVGPNMRLLDVAAGSGALSIAAARTGARVFATDLSPAMLERLQARAHKEALDIESRAMDGNALELEDGTFDVCASQFGVMLFPDMPRGISEMARVAKPGGCVLMNVYGTLREVEFFNFFVDAIRAAVTGFTGPPADPPPLPFQLQDPGRLRAELANAGLKDVRVETITEKLEFRSGAQLWNWLTNSNPITGTVLRALDLSDEQLAAVEQALERKVRERAGAGDVAILTNPINIGIGTRRA